MKNFKSNKSIAILGGMGPQASTKLLEVLIDICTKELGAKNDDDFPEIILNSVAVPDFISNRKNINQVLRILQKRVKLLENFDPGCFGIACNTAHILLKDLQNSTNVPFVSIIDEVTKKIVKSKITRVGLLGTPVTIRSGLYKNKLQNKNIQVIEPFLPEQKVIEDVIRDVLAGNKSSENQQRLIVIANKLKNRGAQGIILGCTELPLIFPKKIPLLIFDSIEILARALINKSRN